MGDDAVIAEEVEGTAVRNRAAFYSPPERPGWEWTLSLSWVAGALGLWVPFTRWWKLGPGHFADNILLGLAAVVIGGSAAAAWALLCRRFSGGTGRAGKCAACGFGAAALVFLLGWPHWIPMAAALWAGIALALLGGVVAVVVGSREENGWGVAGLPGAAVGRFFRPARPWNVWFWVVLLCLLVGRDAFRLLGNEYVQADAGVKWSIFAARFGTQLLLVSGIALLVRLTRALLPRKAAWGADFAASLTVGYILADFLISQMWMPLRQAINGLTASGRFDLGQELEASGTEIGPFVALALLIVFALGCFSLYGALAWLSRKTWWLRPSSAFLLMMGLLGWGLAVGEQVAAQSWKPMDVWQAEVAAFPVQVGPLRPREGLATFKVEFADPSRDVDRETLVKEMGKESPGTLGNLPDVYIFMIESVRKDAITPEHAPFLSRFGSTECQGFGETYAASNCTPLSWFGTFHSRVPVFWSGALSERDAEDRRPGAYPLRLMLAAGYRLQVRAINDLGYKDISTLHFGTGQHLASVYKDDFGRSEGYGFGERERFLFEDLKQEVGRLPRGGNVHVVALDSTHYNYYWPNDFKTPYPNFEEDIFFPLNPTPDQLEKIHHRYYNAVAWVDHALEDFLTFLKSEDRYRESIVIVSGDHGEEFQEHGSWFHCSGMVRQQTEVPIMIKWPESLGKMPPRELASHLDVMPSVLEALGFPEKYRAPLVGRSLLSEKAGGAVIASGWAGRTGIAMALVKPDLKAGFTWPSPWEQRVPDEAHLKQFSNLNDGEVNMLKRGAVERVRSEFGEVIGRFFVRFEEVE